MNIQINPNAWSCLPTAFAMALDLATHDFIRLIGHDGRAEPYKLPGLKAGFHEQECIEAAQSLGYACTPVEILPCITPNADGSETRCIYFGDEDGNWARFLHHLHEADGVITGVYTGGVQLRGHAVAWSHLERMIYDPKGGRTYDLDGSKVNHFLPRCFWKIQKVAK